MEERNIHEIVEEYRRPPMGEVVEEYRRPLPHAMAPRDEREPEFEFDFEDDFEFERYLTRRRRRRNLCIFLACLAVIVVLAVGARFLLPQVVYRYDPFERFPDEDMEEPAVTGEVLIPTIPFGQGAALTVERDGEQTALTAKQVYQRVNPAVVTVMAQQGEGMSVGTGVIFTEDGYILTNFHVLDGGTACRVMLDTGYTYDALCGGRSDQRSGGFEDPRRRRPARRGVRRFRPTQRGRSGLRHRQPAGRGAAGHPDGRYRVRHQPGRVGG